MLFRSVSSVEAVVLECARVIREDGICVAITPNGNWKSLLNVAERLKLKLPEGPHAFLTFEKLRSCFERAFDVVHHRTLLTVPAGPPSLAALIDRLTFSSSVYAGFFQVIVGKRRCPTDVVKTVPVPVGVSQIRMQETPPSEDVRVVDRSAAR